MMKTHGTKITAASTGCSSTMPTSKVGRVGAPRAVVETTNRTEEPTSWLMTIKTESAELHETLREEVAEVTVGAHTASGRQKAMAILAAMYRHSLLNHQIAAQASELGDAEATIVVDELQEVIDDIVIQLEEILATPPASARARHERARQPEAGL